jgi:hypothetical protein
MMPGERLRGWYSGEGGWYPAATLLDTHGSKAYCICQSQPTEDVERVILYAANRERRSYSDLAVQR